ncbi:hypothetical protein V1508DRAFT_254382 [Lipomyces doorenjongii]|uniref:uncharacterized protein n=1 Tax=Lipomyces doorenjongii TaxID=383834 RepID=UPI0034CF25AD
MLAAAGSSFLLAASRSPHATLTLLFSLLHFKLTLVWSFHASRSLAHPRRQLYSHFSLSSQSWFSQSFIDPQPPYCLPALAVPWTIASLVPRAPIFPRTIPLLSACQPSFPLGRHFITRIRLVIVSSEIYYDIGLFHFSHRHFLRPPTRASPASFVGTHVRSSRGLVTFIRSLNLSATTVLVLQGQLSTSLALGGSFGEKN